MPAMAARTGKRRAFGFPSTGEAVLAPVFRSGKHAVHGRPYMAIAVPESIGNPSTILAPGGRKIAGEYVPGGAESLRNGRKCPPPPSPARSSRARSGRKRKQASARSVRPSRASSVELLLQRHADAARRRRHRRPGLGQRLGAPVGGLLLLRQVDAEKLAREVLQAVLVGIGAGQPRGDLGAVERRRHHAEGIREHRDDRSARNGRSSAPTDRRAASSGSAHRSGRARSAPRRRCRRRAKAARRKAGRDAD